MPNAATNSAKDLFDRRAVRDIGDQTDRAPARPFNLGHHVLSRLGTQVVDADFRALAREHQRHLAAQSRTRAGYQHRFVFDFIAASIFFRHAFLELALPIQAPRFGTRLLGFLYHSFLLVEHAQVGEREDVVGLLRDIFFSQLDRGIEVALGLVTHHQPVHSIGVARILLERARIQFDRLVVLIVGVKIDRRVVKLLLVRHALNLRALARIALAGRTSPFFARRIALYTTDISVRSRKERGDAGAATEPGALDVQRRRSL